MAQRDGGTATAYELGIKSNGADSGLVDSATGHHVYLFVESGKVVGREGADSTLITPLYQRHRGATNWDAVLPYYKRHEDHWRGEDGFHGAGNEWRVERQRLNWEILDAFAAAARELREETGLDVGALPSMVHTWPPAAASTAWPAAMSHSMVRPWRG